MTYTSPRAIASVTVRLNTCAVYNELIAKLNVPYISLVYTVLPRHGSEWVIMGGSDINTVIKDSVERVLGTGSIPGQLFAKEKINCVYLLIYAHDWQGRFYEPERAWKVTELGCHVFNEVREVMPACPQILLSDAHY